MDTMEFTIPKNETLWLQVLDKDNNVSHIVTSDKNRTVYKLYQLDNNKLIYTKHKSDNPTDFDKWIWKGK